LVILVATSAAVRSQQFDERFDDWPVELRIKGTLVVAADLDDFGTVKDALTSGKRRRAAVVLDGAARDAKGDIEKQLSTLFDSEQDEAAATAVIRIEKGVPDQFAATVENAEILCWHAATGQRDSQQPALLASRELLTKHLAAGRTLFVLGGASSLCGANCCDSVEGTTKLTEGTSLLPDCIVATNYVDRADRGRLLAGLALKPRSVGIGIEKNTAIILSGRTIRVVGAGSATFVLMANERLPLRVQTIRAQESPRQAPEDYLVDLTEWRRDAIDRTLEQFPPEKPGEPRVEHGSLVIVGGGGMPRGLMRRFVELAGGAEKAKLVYVPCEEADDVGERHYAIEEWKQIGVKQTAFIHTKDRRRANEEAFAEPLEDATGIWFGGGRQWNLSDSYYGTTAHRMMKEVLKRGGVIGGSSAGASIQARYLARGTPIGNFRIMAPGYERGGLGFIDGVAIDQHFSQRGRHKDMTSLVAKYPQLLGIGLDEATAIVVQKSAAEVVGRGKVHFYDRRQPVFPDRPDFVALADGGQYDLVARKVIETEDKSKREPPPSATEPN
jgi:cyanophycinase